MSQKTKRRVIDAIEVLQRDNSNELNVSWQSKEDSYGKYLIVHPKFDQMGQHENTTYGIGILLRKLYSLEKEYPFRIDGIDLQSKWIYIRFE